MNRKVARGAVRSGLSAAVVVASLIAAGGISAPSASAATQKLVAPNIYPVGGDPWTYVGTYSSQFAAEMVADQIEAEHEAALIEECNIAINTHDWQVYSRN
jgi:hypothetical protein